MPLRVPSRSACTNLDKWVALINTGRQTTWLTGHVYKTVKIQSPDPKIWKAFDTFHSAPVKGQTDFRLSGQRALKKQLVLMKKQLVLMKKLCWYNIRETGCPFNTPLAHSLHPEFRHGYNQSISQQPRKHDSSLKKKKSHKELFKNY